VSMARVKLGDAAIRSAQARVKIAEEALENTNVRAPFDGVVIKKRAEIGETVSPFGVQGQATREGGAIATIADLSELEVQTEVSENGVAKLTPSMPAEVKLQAYQDRVFHGRLRQIFPSADRAKSIVEVRVTILDPDVQVKPEMTASVTFQEKPAVRSASDGDRAAGGLAPGSRRVATGSASNPDGVAVGSASDAREAPIVVIPKRALIEVAGRPHVWIVSNRTATRRPVTLGSERLDQIEVRSGVAAGDAVILNPPAGLTDRSLVRVKGT